MVLLEQQQCLKNNQGLSNIDELLLVIVAHIIPLAASPESTVEVKPASPGFF